MSGRPCCLASKMPPYHHAIGCPGFERPIHPAEVTQLLGAAYQKMNRLIEAAEKRGDRAGADVWLAARDAIDNATRAVDEARSKQNWERKR